MGQTLILSPKRAPVILAALTIVGAALRLHLLSARSLWVDEAASVHFASVPWWPFLRLLAGYQGNMTLYYFLLRAWIHLGDSEFVVRGLSVLFGVLTIPVMYALGARLFDRATGLAAAALLTVHSFHVQWSQEARGYSLLLLLLVLATYALVSAMESNQESHWVIFAFVAALCVYAHIFAVLVLIAHALAIAFPGPFRIGRRNVAATLLAFALFIAPMAAWVLREVLGHSSQINWIPQPTRVSIFQFLELLTARGGWLLVVIYLSLCGLAFVRAGSVASSYKENWALRLFALWLVLPPLLTLAATPIKVLFLPRYMVICVPAVVMLAARGLANLYRMAVVERWAAAACFILVMTLSARGALRYFTSFATEATDWRSAVSFILQHQQPGDGAVFYRPNVNPYIYYVHRAQAEHGAAAAPEILFPSALGRPLSREEVRSDIYSRKRVWLILHMNSDSPALTELIQSTLAEKLQLQEENIFPSGDAITVALYAQPQTSR
jgi:mannosyltransferase